jgi:hypothetical protein
MLHLCTHYRNLVGAENATLGRIHEVLKGTWTRKYNWLKVVWYDGSWLGDIKKCFNCPFNFLLNKEILCHLARKAFENRRDRLWPAFKIG